MKNFLNKKEGHSYLKRDFFLKKNGLRADNIFECCVRFEIYHIESVSRSEESAVMFSASSKLTWASLLITYHGRGWSFDFTPLFHFLTVFYLLFIILLLDPPARPMRNYVKKIWYRFGEFLHVFLSYNFQRHFPF